MRDEQKISIQFYTTNDYLLINGLLWEESQDVLNEMIELIHTDGLAVMREAEQLGFDVRWKCSKEEGERLYKIYQDRFPTILNDTTKDEIICRAKQDIQNLLSCMKPLNESLVLYRNIKSKFVKDIQEGDILDYKGFSSCSLNPHIPENAMYGTRNSTFFEIIVNEETPVIRLDEMPDIANELDEIILPPSQFLITKIDKKNNKIFMKWIRHLNENHM